MHWKDNKLWSDQFMPQVAVILRANAMHIMTIAIASQEEDMHKATDLLLTVTGGSVAVRMRRSAVRFRDFTIRSQTRYGSRDTELRKLRSGFADWYLYGWVGEDGKINDWALVDLHKFRASGLLDGDVKEIPNPDGSAFVAFNLCDLEATGSLVARQISPEPELPF